MKQTFKFMEGLHDQLSMQAAVYSSEASLITAVVTAAPHGGPGLLAHHALPHARTHVSRQDGVFALSQRSGSPIQRNVQHEECV